MATLTVLVFLVSMISVTEHIKSSLIPILRQAERKLSTFLLHLAPVSLGTAGEGTCILETAR